MTYHEHQFMNYVGIGPSAGNVTRATAASHWRHVGHAIAGLLLAIGVALWCVTAMVMRLQGRTVPHR